MHPAPLPRRREDLRNGSLQSEMRVGNHELHAAKSPTRQAPKELRPKRFGFARADRHAEHFTYALGIHPDGDYYGNRDDSPAPPDFHVRRVDPEVRPVALDRPIEKR